MSDPAVVVGAGPNGLSAAVELARAGLRVIVYEGAERIGGGTRTEELTLPGFLHDVCSAVHPLGASSPYFRELPLGDHGLEWVHPGAPLAHPFDDGTAAILERCTRETAATLDAADREAYPALLDPFVREWDTLVKELLAPLHVPSHPLVMARFAVHGMLPALTLARARFEGPRARALFCGIAAHALLPIEKAPTAAFGLVLAIAGHAVGWPIARGGSQRIAEALASILRAHGGDIVTDAPVRSLEPLPRSSATLLDVTPRQLLDIAGQRLPPLYRWRLRRYRYGSGVCKVDWALSAPIPWRARDCARATTVHIGGTAEEIAASSRAAEEGRLIDRPFVLLAQPTLFDPSRAPAGHHTAWAYCHVPHGSDADRSAAIEAQVERFAPGFRDTILARSVKTAVDMERHDPNLVGGDINGGIATLKQLFLRPVAKRDPYATPIDGLFLCSASTPPGGGVHGMCGFHAARSALRRAASQGQGQGKG